MTCRATLPGMSVTIGSDAHPNSNCNVGDGHIGMRMGERKIVSSWVAIASIALISLLALAALYAPRHRHPKVAAKVTPTAHPIMPIVNVWLSTEDRRLRLAQQPDIDMSARESLPVDVDIDINRKYQSIVGFGAAMTDSSAWLLQDKLNGVQRSALLLEMFGPPPNLNLNMMRLTIGASDFSLQQYTLDDLPFGQVDPTLQHFNVVANSLEVIPTVREVLSVNPQLRIIASSWSAPAWMKDSENLIGGALLPQYESTFADYLVKYLDAYRGYGIPIFALSLQNEPGFIPVTYPGMDLPAATRARIIAQYLGPALASRNAKTRILEWDHNWDQPGTTLERGWPTPMRRAISMVVAWHCYERQPVCAEQGAPCVSHKGHLHYRVFRW